METHKKPWQEKLRENKKLPKIVKFNTKLSCKVLVKIGAKEKEGYIISSRKVKRIM